MNRRTFLSRITAGAAVTALTPWDWRLKAAEAEQLAARFPALAELAMSLATSRGATFADFRIQQTDNESLYAREDMIQGISAGSTIGCSVRVLKGGAWGFAASESVSDKEVARLVEAAIDLAERQAGWQLRPIEIETLPAHIDTWRLPVEVDPFEIALEDKAAILLEIDQQALKAGANYCDSHFRAVRERKWLANTAGSRIDQTRIRVAPGFSVTVLDPKKGGFASRESFAPPAAAGFEYIRDYPFAEESGRAVEEAREKLLAPSVTPGRKDIVIAPSNLWLTIHETVGHPTELDRALGYEANFAGTSFCTPEKLGKLQYASERVTIRADRSQEGGLATVAYDDDGVKTAGREFNIIDRGIFSNYQMALGQAAKIGLDSGSNGCAYADDFSSVPLQRMPNISLQPGEDPAVTADDLIAGVDDGIYVVGRGSWSIDQQRYNFQFTGQLFYKIRNGKLNGMLRDVAYQGNSVDFWNACDGLGGAPTYELGGAFNCGKGRPMQSAPVSHGAVPARFRQVNILNTESEAGKEVASAFTPSGFPDACCSGGC